VAKNHLTLDTERQTVHAYYNFLVVFLFAKASWTKDKGNMSIYKDDILNTSNSQQMSVLR